jgi:ATP-dependent Clp protease protease subunit
MISNRELHGAKMPPKKYEEWTSEDRITAKLLDQSTFFLTGDISEENINDCIKWLVYENLSAQGSNKTLTLYVNSQGGDLYEALGLIDMMKNSKLRIRTIGYGSVMSAAFLIVAAGTKGERYIAQNTGIMCHQFSSIEDVGKYHDIKATRKEIDRLHQAMYNVLKDATELDGRTIKNKLLPAHDVYMTAEEMISYNAADFVLTK